MATQESPFWAYKELFSADGNVALEIFNGPSREDIFDYLRLGQKGSLDFYWREAGGRVTRGLEIRAIGSNSSGGSDSWFIIATVLIPHQKAEGDSSSPAGLIYNTRTRRRAAWVSASFMEVALNL
jgi:hypothetical protein